MRKFAALVALVVMVGCKAQQSKEDSYINRQLKIIDAHEKQLVAMGRITDPEHFNADLYLTTYSWHSSGGGGSFGAYFFSPQAFEQAKKLFVVHGTVDAGTDILVDAQYGYAIPNKNGGIWWSSDGSSSPVGKGAFDPSVVGYNVGSLTYCQSYGNHSKYCDEPGLWGAKVIRFIDKGHVQISKMAKHDAVMFGLVIAPADYVDMCECTTPIEHVETDSPPAKPCVQGGTLGPGESCSVSIGGKP